MILPRAYGFIFSRVLVFFPFLWTPKIQGTALLRAYWYKKNVKKHGCILMLHYYARAYWWRNYLSLVWFCWSWRK